MGELRGLGRQRNDRSPFSTSFSGKVKPDTVKPLIRKLEAKNSSNHQGSSEKDFLPLPSFRPFTLFCPELGFRRPSPAPSETGSISQQQFSTGQHSRILTPALSIEQTSIAKIKQKSSEQLSTQFSSIGAHLERTVANVASEPQTTQHDIFDLVRGASSEHTVPPLDIVPPLNLNTRVYSMAYAGDSAADGLRRLEARPDSLSLASSLELAVDGSSFDTSMHDFLQNEPDFPIGGTKAPPIVSKQTVTVGTQTFKSTEIPYIETSTLDLPECCEEDLRRKHQKTQSSSSNDRIRLENTPMLTSMETLEQVRSPQAKTERDAENSNEGRGQRIYRKPEKLVKSDESDGYYMSKSPFIPGARIGSFVQSPKPSVESYSNLSPTSHPHAEISTLAQQNDGPFSFSKTAKLQAAAESPAKSPKAPEAPSVPDTKAIPSDPPVLEAADTKALPGASSLPDIPDAEVVPGTELPKAPELASKLDIAVSAPDVGIPTDTTGQLPLPRNGPKPTRRKRLKNKVLTTIRRVRPKLLRKRVLVPVVGRQLAGPLSNALQTITKKLPVDPSSITDAASPPVIPV